MGGFYTAMVKSSGSPVIVRVVDTHCQIVERIRGIWKYDQNWYPVKNFTDFKTYRAS
jgi:hypothetical protein